MDNSLKTFIRHALKVATDYVAMLFVFVIFSFPIISLSGDNPSTPVRWFSGLLFLGLFSLVYKDLWEIAVRERRPQYEINPKPLRGLLLGLAGISPVALVLIVIAVLPMTGLEILQLRMLQAVGVPYYWVAKLMDASSPMHRVPFILLPFLTAFMAFIGYWAGLSDFYLMQRVYKLIGYTPKKRVRKPLKKTRKGFWGM